LFEWDIEKLLRKGRNRLKQNQENKEGGLDLNASNSQSQAPQPENMTGQIGNKNNDGGIIVNPQGESAMKQGPRYFLSIIMPTVTRSLEIKPTFFNLICSHEFR